MKSVLIVEDMESTQAWLAEAVEKAFDGAQIARAASLAEAGAALRESHPDLVLVDLGLPDGRGNELIAAINGMPNPPICVVVTVYDDDQHLFPSLKAGAHGYVLKDQPIDQLAEKLRGVVTGEPPLSPQIARRLLRVFGDASDYESMEEAGLTEREEQVLVLIAKGYSTPRAAELLKISHYTVTEYIRNVYRKLNVSNRAEAAVVAARLGLLNI